MPDQTAREPVRLEPSRAVEPLPQPDARSRRIIERVRAGDNLVVLGAAGTGKTTLALRLLVQAVRGGRDALLLAPTRARADLARARIAQLLEGRGGGRVRARTPAGLALTILTTSLTGRADPLPAPVLLAGAEEDAALAELINPEQWPGLPPEAVTSRAFRTELRNLLARAGELGVGADELAELGRCLAVAEWGPASALLRTWDAQGRPGAHNRGRTRRMDSARLQDRAIEALSTWQADAVLAQRPVPDLVIVDDYQDCTAATARLLAALAAPDATGHRSQVVVLGDPDLAVETFRGGTPSLLVEAEDRSGLAAGRVHLTLRHRGGGALEAVWRDQADRIPVTGTASHRHPEPADSCADGAGGQGTRVSAVVASSHVQQSAHVARMLREEHIGRGTGWGAMAVIVRSAAQVQAVARQLRRRGVPLASTTPAVLLRSERAAGALIAVARAGLDHCLGGADALPSRPGVIDLLTSPLVGLSALDLRRIRRRLRQDRPVEDSADENLMIAVSTPERAGALAERLAAEPLAEQSGAVLRAARIMEAVREVVAAGRAESGRVDAEALLWAAWHASGRAQAWRDRALERAGHADSLLAEAAEHDLDVVTALFKRAEVWAERHPGLDGGDFLTELAGEVLPSDSVAPQGVRPEGVSVLTPASAAGRQWEVVAVMGLERDSWPDLRLRDTLTRSGLLVDAVTGRLPLRADGSPGEQDAASARAQVRADERRMLLAALTRARRRLMVTATLDEDHAPSNFFLEIARAAGAEAVDAQGRMITAADVGDLTLRGLVGELRNAAVAGHLPGAAALDRQRARAASAALAHLAGQGVAGACPSHWLGVRGPSTCEPLVAGGQRVRVSPSDVEALTSCPLKWFLQRHGGGGPISSAQRVGNLIHSLAEEAQREALGAEEVMARFEQRLPELGYPRTWLGGVEEDRVRQMVSRLSRYLESVPGHVEVERPVRADLLLPVLPDAPEEEAQGGQEEVEVTVVGRIDRLEHLGDSSHAPGKVRLIDLKTGKNVPKDAQQHPQLATYRLALQAGGYEVDGAALVMLGKEPLKRDAGMPVLAPPGAALAPSPDPRTGEDWAVAMLSRAAQAARGPFLLARSGEQCRGCPVRDSCPAQPEGRRTVA